MNSKSLVHGGLTIFALSWTIITLSSCSHPRKEKSKSPLLVAEVIGEPALTEEKIASLKRIAEDPNSQLSEKTPGVVEPPIPSLEPSLAWKKGDFDPRRIRPGDIFFEQDGAILHKAASIADILSSEEWLKVLESYGEQEKRTVPLTLSHNEIVELAHETGGRVALPSRSVALDFHTLRQEIKPRKMESYLGRVSGTPSPSDRSTNLAVLSDSLAELPSRISSGEAFFIVTSVTSSDVVKVSYPGAPIGRSDSERILNALSALYPHLDQLRAEKVEGSILVTRDPKIYWEFEASRLILEEGELKIQRNEPPPLFSLLSIPEP